MFRCPKEQLNTCDMTKSCRYQALTRERDLLNSKWDEQNSLLVQSHERVIQDLTEEYEQKLQEEQVIPLLLPHMPLLRSSSTSSSASSASDAPSLSNLCSVAALSLLLPFLFFFASCTVHSHPHCTGKQASIGHTCTIASDQLFYVHNMFIILLGAKVLGCTPGKLFVYVERQSGRTTSYGPNSHGTATVLLLSCIPLKAQQQDEAQALYNKIGQHSAGSLVAGKSEAPARESMNYTRRGMNTFRRDSGANKSRLCLLFWRQSVKVTKGLILCR